MADDTLHVETAGTGPPVVLLHAGLCDSRMWDPQWTALSTVYRVIRCDFRGFGESPPAREPFSHARDVLAVLDRLGVDRAALIGASLGGRTAIEIAVAHPDRVSALLLVAPGLVGHAWSDEVKAFWAEEEQALRRGDLDTAVEMNLQIWLYGPGRGPDSVDPGVRELVARMQRRAFESEWLDVDEVLLAPDAADRLAGISAPTSVVIGDHDVSDLQVIADKVVAQIPGARRTVIPGTAHLPNLERPAEFNRHALDFLAQVPA